MEDKPTHIHPTAEKCEWQSHCEILEADLIKLQSQLRKSEDKSKTLQEMLNDVTKVNASIESKQHIQLIHAAIRVQKSVGGAS